ncbi:hypothetical protein CMV_023871 [Castanea mollissima]|uniref:Uncharacterized protein n=1 Tax=Castanea mollissima TaxID=60419 RepID=A0A8J4QJ89_9ROSI|nr:hypothetical protein CMV_023871 [Castanea mollissima]
MFTFGSIPPPPPLRLRLGRFGRTLPLPLLNRVSLSLKLHSLNPTLLSLDLCVSLNSSTRHHRYHHTQLRPISKNKEKIATLHLIPNPQTLTRLVEHFLDPNERESERKGWGLERIRCREKLILLGFDLGREVGLRDRERDFVPKKSPSEVVVSGGCDEPWQQRERKRLTGAELKSPELEPCTCSNISYTNSTNFPASDFWDFYWLMAQRAFL